MIIRSQDKRSITIDLNLSIKIESRIMSSCLKEEFPRQAMFRIVDSKDIPLGDYSTEEKAIKVLDMIQSAYNAIETMKIDKCAWRDNRFFNMPLDEEIEV